MTMTAPETVAGRIFRCVPNSEPGDQTGLEGYAALLRTSVARDWPARNARLFYILIPDDTIREHRGRYSWTVGEAANPGGHTFSLLNLPMPSIHVDALGEIIERRGPAMLTLNRRVQRIADMEQKLQRFSELPENWNSYGASAPTSAVIEEARKILTAVIDLGLSEPWVAPGGDGSIGLQWETDKAFLYIDIVPGEATTYFHSPKTEGIGESEGTLTPHNLHEVLRRFGESAIQPKP